MAKSYPARPKVIRCSPDLQSEIEEKLNALLVTQRHGKQASKFCPTDADRTFMKLIMEDLDKQISALRAKLKGLHPEHLPAQVG